MKGVDVAMVHENETHIYGDTAENCVDLAKTVNSPKLRLVYDPGNFVWGQKITEQRRELLAFDETLCRPHPYQGLETRRRGTAVCPARAMAK